MFAIEKNTRLLRMAVPSDAAALLAIYAPYVKQTPITFEYEVPSEAEFAERVQKVLADYPYLVYETNRGIMGYAYASRHRERAAYAWNAELSIYVDRSFRGQGIGTHLYTVLLELLRAQGVRNAYACITYPNDESICFHERLGFQHLGRFPDTGYKLGAWHGVVWMGRGLSESPIEAVRPIGALPARELSARLNLSDPAQILRKSGDANETAPRCSAH